MLTATQSSAFAALLAASTEAQRAALLNVLSSFVEDVECSDAAADSDSDDVLATEGHLFIVDLSDTLAAAIAD